MNGLYHKMEYMGEIFGLKICIYHSRIKHPNVHERSHGVMVSTLDFESSDPSSNLGGTCIFFIYPSGLLIYGLGNSFHLIFFVPWNFFL